MLLLSSKDQQ